MTSRFLALFLITTVQAVAVGDNWQFSQPVPTSEDLLALAYDGSKFVAVGEHGAILTSADGSTWQGKASALVSRLSGITWTGTQFVAVGSQGTIATSPTGDGWSPQVSPLKLAWRAVTWDGTRLIAVGTQARWRPLPMARIGAWCALAWCAICMVWQPAVA